MKIAFVCDWLTGMRGGEKCLLAMSRVFPDADIFTLVCYPENFNHEFEWRRVHTSFIQRLPGNVMTFRRWLLLFPKAVESFSFKEYDLVLSFSHCVAKGVKTPANIPHICYCHTPMRYVWEMRKQYLDSLGLLKQKIVGIMLDHLKEWDVSTAQRVDHFITNSRHVQQRIKNSYGCDSTVIYPPVDMERFVISEKSDNYYLVLSAMVPYKRIDLAVEAFGRNGRRLIVAGGGPDSKRLKSIAKSNIEFVWNPGNSTVEQLYAGCKALIFPGEEDFGIVPLEAQASGKPVIAYGRGGALETIAGLDSPESRTPTGIFFRDQSVTCLNTAIEQFEKNETVFIPQNCRQNAQRFNRSRYQSEMTAFIQAVMAQSGRSE